MRPERWIEVLLGTQARVRVLRLLARDPRRTRTEREIARAIGMSPSTVNAAIRQLRDADVLDSQRIGRTHAVRLRTDLAVVRAVQELFGEEATTLSQLEARIQERLPRGVACYLHGSTARGTASPESDLDILVVASDRERATEAAAAVSDAVQGLLPARLGIIAIDVQEARRRRRSAFLRSVQREGRSLGTVHLEELL